MVSSYDTRKEKRKEKKNENYHYFFMGKLPYIQSYGFGPFGPSQFNL